MTPAKPACYVFDLDGTLADCEHRRGLVTPPNRRWDDFYAACVRDAPIYEVHDVMRALSIQNNKIVIASGRSDAVRHETVDWLYRHGAYYDLLLMRPARDHRPDWQLKEEMLDKAILPYYEVRGVFDDRDQTVAMWRRRGLRCYQVAPGDF